MSSSRMFSGHIGTTLAESLPDWPAPPPAHNGDAPNVVIILFDDTGFGNFGCYGSSISTPNIDALAENGLRYSNFHGPRCARPHELLCSPDATTTPWAWVRSRTTTTAGFRVSAPS